MTLLSLHFESKRVFKPTGVSSYSYSWSTLLTQQFLVCHCINLINLVAQGILVSAPVLWIQGQVLGNGGQGLTTSVFFLIIVLPSKCFPLSSGKKPCPAKVGSVLKNPGNSLFEIIPFVVVVVVPSLNSYFPLDSGYHGCITHQTRSTQEYIRTRSI